VESRAPTRHIQFELPRKEEVTRAARAGVCLELPRRALLLCGCGEVFQARLLSSETSALALEARAKTTICCVAMAEMLLLASRRAELILHPISRDARGWWGETGQPQLPPCRAGSSECAAAGPGHHQQQTRVHKSPSLGHKLRLVFDVPR